MSKISKKIYPKELEEKFLEYLESEGICFGCRKKHEDLFMVDDSEWKGIVPKNFEERVICWKCYCKWRKNKGLPDIDYKNVKLNHGPLKSKYFKLTHFSFNKEELEECIKDLKRVLKIFESKSDNSK